MEEQRVKATGEAARSCDCSPSYFKLLATEIGLQPTRLGSGNLLWTDEQVEQVRRLRERRRRNPEGVRP
jgi:DNA-binding transcriptional MerR regulator